MLLPFVRTWRPERSLKPGAWLYRLALPLGINEALLKPRFPETHNLVSDWSIVIHYLLLTLYGVGLASLRGAWDWFDALRRVSLAAGACCSVAACSRSRRASSRTNSPAGALFANMFTWVWLAVFLGYGHRHLSHTNRWLAWSREARYPIYILHQTVIIGLVYFIVPEPWSPWLKYWRVLGATLAICVLLYEGVLRRSALLRLLFGILGDHFVLECEVREIER